MNLGKAALIFGALIIPLSFSRAIAFAEDLEAEAYYKKSLEEMQAQKEGVRNDYLKNQNSDLGAV